MKHCLFILLAACLCLTSCSTLDMLAVDTLMPADVSFAPDVKRMAVLDNTLPAPSDHTLTVGNTIAADSRVLCDALASHIADADYFDTVIICDSLLRSDAADTSVLLSPEEVQSLARDLGVDMLFVVNAAAVSTTREMVYSVYDDEERVPAVRGAMMLDAHIYLPGRDRPFQHFTDRDTLYWEADGLTERQLVDDASRRMAMLPVRHVVPLWDTVERYYYRGGTVNMRDGAVAMAEGDWDLAARCWQREYDSRKGRQKMRAAFNLALYHEMKGDIAGALKQLKDVQDVFAGKYASSGKDVPTEWHLLKVYEAELQQKDMIRQKLDLQMAR